MSLIPSKIGLAALALGLVLTASASQGSAEERGIYMSAPRARRPFKSAMPGQANIWNYVWGDVEIQVYREMHG